MDRLSRTRRSAACALLVLVAAAACGTGELPVRSTAAPTTFADPAPAYAAIERAETAQAQAVYLTALRRRAASVQARTASVGRPIRVAVVAAPGALGPCGGDLPPCWVKKRESGGDYRIWNRRCYAPIGYTGSRSPCGGSTASGGWQILRSTWAGFGGYLNAADAPPDVQDARARQLWAECPRTAHWGTCSG